jgi:branched-chain amino acid transport system substrate-binding protein
MTLQRLSIAAIAAILAVSCAETAALAQEKVTVTFIGPLTGGNAAAGVGGRNSAALAVQLQNADEASKYEYEMLVLDDECKPNIAVQAATRAAASQDVIAGVTHYCSAVAIATVDTYHKFGLPVIVWGAVLPEIIYGNDYPEIHRVNGTMINQNQTAAEFMTELGFDTWVIVHDTTDYGQGHKEYFTEYVTERGGEVLATFGVTADQQDFTAVLTEAKSLNPDVIFFGGLTPIGVRIRSQMDKLGMDAEFQGTSGIVSDAYIEALGPLAEGTVAFREGAPTEKLPGGQYFMEQYEKAGFDQPPEAYGPFAFAAMNLVIDAIETVGPDREKVMEALNAVEGRDSIIGEITFDDHGQNAVALITKFVVQDGKWVVWEDSEYASGERKLTGMQ